MKSGGINGSLSACGESVKGDGGSKDERSTPIPIAAGRACFDDVGEALIESRSMCDCVSP